MVLFAEFTIITIVNNNKTDGFFMVKLLMIELQTYCLLHRIIHIKMRQKSFFKIQN